MMLEHVTEQYVSAAAPTSSADREHVLHRDYESRSCKVLRIAGTFKYATDPTTEVLCCAYAVDDEPVQLWTPGDPVPAEFVEAANNPNWIVCAHGAHFEDAIERYVLHPRIGWPTFPVEKQVCTQAMALAVGLPARLGLAAIALELGNRKDAAGERLMLQTSKPRRPHKDEDPTKVYWFEDAGRLQRLNEYCRQDVEVERELFTRLPPLSASEQARWELSSRINTRGFHVDRALAQAARKIAEAAAPEIDAEITEITNGAVTTISQVARLLSWLREQGCGLDNLGRKTIEKQLQADDLFPQVRRALELRLSGAQAAVKKVDALLLRAGDDDRVRGSFRYHGAAPGRWSGEGLQPQNLKRVAASNLDAAVAAVETGDYQHVKGLYPKPLAVVGDCIRAMINAAPGHMLIGADFSAIESRVLAWVAGETWKLDSYRRFDATNDPADEPYCETACRIFRVPSGSYTKDSPERAVGKVCDLAFGYMGGINAWRKFEPDRFTDDEVKKFCSEWRASHPAIRKLWYALDRAALVAVRERGRVVRCGSIAIKSAGGFLLLKLPSGRKISYPLPRAVGDAERQHVTFLDNASGQFTECRGGHGAYGGLWTENVVSGIARDLLAGAMLRIEAAGYSIVLHVHDEIVAEVPEASAASTSSLS
jgi:DNA polymerase